MADGDETKPVLPTYNTVAEVLEKKNGSGWRLAGWTAARTALIFPPMVAVGVEWKRALLGSILSSTLISVFTLVRIYNAGFEEEAKERARRARLRKRLVSRRRFKPEEVEDDED